MEPEIIGTINENRLREIIIDYSPVKFKNTWMFAAFYKYRDTKGVIFIKEGDRIRHKTLPDTVLWDVFYSYVFKNSNEANTWFVELRRRAGMPLVTESRKKFNYMLEQLRQTIKKESRH